LQTKVYEGLFLFDSNRYARDPSGVPAAVDETIKKAGGDMLASRLWNEQKLAYQINGHRKGTYWLTYFRIETDKLPGINREFQLNDSILRNLVLAVDERLVEPLVQHAVPGGKKESTSAPASDAGAKATAKSASS
jgi:small subunit ribosomal protein S6